MARHVPKPPNMRLLYGTIGLCTATTGVNLLSQGLLRETIHNRDPKLANDLLKQRPFMERHFMSSRRNLDEGRYYTLLTSAFNHGSVMHYLGNMLGLWSIGRMIVFSFGIRTLMGLFYGGAVAGNVLALGMDRRLRDTTLDPKTGRLMQRGSGVRARSAAETGNYLGASGGVCATVAASACAFPRYKIMILIGFIPVALPQWAAALGFAGFSAWAQTSGFEGGVAHLGHLGGLVFGAAWYIFALRRRMLGFY